MLFSKEIELLICDFDGTLVDTFEANYHAYKKAFQMNGIKELTEDFYRKCFGLRFEAFMEKAGISDNNTRSSIKNDKMKFYPLFFDLLKPNETLISFIKTFKKAGGKTAIASTARKENLIKVLEYLQINDIFDLILSGKDVSKGKPDPEIYNKVLRMLGINASNALVFEDSEVGIKAAQAAGISFIKINSYFYGD